MLEETSRKNVLIAEGAKELRKVATILTFGTSRR